MARVRIRGGVSPVFRVSRSGYDAANPATPEAGISFDAVRQGNGTLYMAGHITETAVAAAGGLICAYPHFGYVPHAMVLARAGYSGGAICNVLMDGITIMVDGIARVLNITGSQKVTDYYYFVFTERQV